MSPNRREVLLQLAALAALPLPRWPAGDEDPLSGTIAGYRAGLERGEWTVEEVTVRALERSRTDGAAWRAVDALSGSALDEARAADRRRRAGRSLGSLDGVPVFAKAIYDMQGSPPPAPTRSGRGSSPHPCDGTRWRWRACGRPAR